MEITTTITPALCQDPRLAMPSTGAAFGRARVWHVAKRNVPGVPVWSPPHW